MIEMKPEGIYVPNITPFDARGEINYGALERLIEHWVAGGVYGIVANASTGEAPYLSREEKTRIIEFMVEKVNGRVQVFAGTGAMGTRETIELTRDAKEAGAEAALVTTPFFFKPSGDEIAGHFIALMDAVDLPVILYNVPKFTGYSVVPEVVARIAEESSNLVAMKDSGGNPGNMAEVIRLCGDRISALSGSADMVLPTLMLGGRGAIVAVANVIPEACVGIYDSYKKNDLAGAGRNQHKASYVNKVLVREHPQIAAIKTALNQMGLDAGVPRMPLTPLDAETQRKIEDAMKLL
ncbi:4-hydroxy-tetrahydrodipicolinate synthase [Candidatus Bathyarchaeota archaeon]|nr:4-hydroxy-tetrahydrodipicolinate synthase [Candidatus Bathyarchaeota archaeon]